MADFTYLLYSYSDAEGVSPDVPASVVTALYSPDGYYTVAGYDALAGEVVADVGHSTSGKSEHSEFWSGNSHAGRSC